MFIKMSKMQNYKNISMNIFAFIIQFIINFYTVPIMVSKLGASTYGFIGIANDFVSYASILSTIFNSVSSRFIANAFYKQDYLKANYYFNSLIVTNIGISFVLGLINIILNFNLQRILSIPTEIIFDVKLTFTLIFVSYIISLLTLVFTTSTYITNRTDIQGLRNIINHLIRFALIIILVNFVSVKIYWIAVSTLIATFIISILNITLTKKLTPELKINLKLAKIKYALELAKSGCWMVLINTSTILMHGLDLFIANNYLNSYDMGMLSIARTMPNNVTSVINMLAPLFTPVFISLYVQHDIESLVLNIKKSINTMTILMYVPLCGFLIFSYDFYRLWQSSMSANEVQIITILSSITIIQAFFNSSTVTLAQVSIVTNRLKIPVIISLGCGILNIILVIILLKITSLGLYAIVLSSTFITILRYVIFNSAYAAYVLDKPKNLFIKSTLKTWIIIPILLFTMGTLHSIFNINTWKSLLIPAIICAGIGYAEMFLLYRKFLSCSN